VLDGRWFKASALAEADVLVVGDSFSVGLVWQASLVSQGRRVSTLQWKELGDAICGDLASRLRAQGFRGRQVVLQSVEREVVARIEKSQRCGTEPAQSASGRLAREGRMAAVPLASPPQQQLNWSEKFTTGVVSWVNRWRVLRHDEVRVGDPESRDRVQVRRLAQGCAWFSHALCSHALFLAGDIERAPLSASHVPQLNELSRRLSGFEVTWLIVPNKSTVYLGSSSDFWRALAAQGMGPDVLGVLSGQLGQGKDLYFPNDTHLSPRGYVSLGELMRSQLMR
jgi:hypothetical protein